MRTPQGFHIDNPAWPLVQAQISYWGMTSAAGNVLGTTLIDANLANEPSYQGLSIKLLDGGAAGQVRPVQVHAGGTLTVAPAFTNSAGAVVQVVAGTRFVVLSAASGGGIAPAVAPSIGLWMFGVCDPGMAASTTALVLTNLAGFPNDIFNNEFWVQVIHNANAVGAAPEREIRRVTDYVGATGTFTCDAFTVNVEANDLVAVFHESILSVEVLGFGTLTASSATVPADAGRAALYAWETNDYFKGSLLLPTEGATRFQARRITAYTAATGVFEIDPANPFTAATGLVDYVIVGGQADFVSGVDSARNITPGDVVGNKADTIPAMNAAPGTDSLQRHVKAILERVGATPADPDDSLLTGVGQRDAAATLDDLSDVTTTDLQAKIRRLLLRMSPDAFSAVVQGAARTELDTMVAQLAAYISAAGAAFSGTFNPGAGARTNIEQALEDLADVLAGTNGVVTYPAAAVPADGVSLAEVLRQIYNDLVSASNALPRVQELLVYPVAEDLDVTELTDTGASPAFMPVAAASTNSNSEAAPGVAWTEDVDFEQQGTVTVISFYAEFEWQSRVVVGLGDATESRSKIQISRDGGVTWVDLTDNFNNVAVAMATRVRAGVGRWVGTIVAGVNQLQFRLAHWTNDTVGGAGRSTSEAQIRSNSYVRLTYRKS